MKLQRMFFSRDIAVDNKSSFVGASIIIRVSRERGDAQGGTGQR